MAEWAAASRRRREKPLVSVLGSSSPTGERTPTEDCDSINLIKTGLLNTTKPQGTFIFQLTVSRSKDTAWPLLSFPYHPSSPPQP